MMQDEQERLEAGLRQIPPAAPPAELMARLRAATATAQSKSQGTTRAVFHLPDFLSFWRMAGVGVSAAVTILLTLLLWRPEMKPAKTSLASATGMDVNAVQVGHSLLASFDTVAQAPDGEPVRFRWREWEDNVVIHDDAHGVVVSKTVPRIEVVPVRIETY
jgi:anti-sigma-K factor RskA